MTGGVSGAAMVAGVVGYPVLHSLSPCLHGAWIAAAGLDAAYVPFAPGKAGLQALVQGFRGGAVRGVNVTLPFKEEALALCEHVDSAAQTAGAVNLLLFAKDGTVEGRNTDGLGLINAFAKEVPEIDLTSGPVVMLGAGGAARGALAVLKQAGVRDLRIVNRSPGRATALAGMFGGRAFAIDQAASAFEGASAIINASSAGLGGSPAVYWPLEAAPASAAVLDMVYRPLITPLLDQARRRGMPIVDGLAMLIEQARPSFEAFFGQPPPAEIDARALLMAAIG